MKAAPRRTRARRGEGDLLREEILDATERLLIERGDTAAVSIRAIADAVGVTSPSIYLHFADKDELLFAVCERHFAELDAAIDRAMQGITDHMQRLSAMGHAYVEFGVKHPEQYRILFMGRTQPEDEEAFLERLKEVACFDRLVAEIADAMKAGALPEGDAFTIATTLWSVAHGMTSLRIAKPLFPWPKDFVSFTIDRMCVALSSEG